MILVRQLPVGAVGLALFAIPVVWSSAAAQLLPPKPSGQSVTPVFEGWYRNSDGTYSLSFGYFNRNTDETIDVGIGASNFVSPGDANQGQPSVFAPRRHWGVFAVVVPADFGTRTVVWTLKNRDQTFSIAGSLKPDWEIDALEGEAGSDNTPPVLRLGGGVEGRGPLGRTAGPLRVTVGTPLQLSVEAVDDGKTRAPVVLTWFSHQGPGTVVFATPTNRLTPTGGTGTTTATFSRPGDYLLRIRANDSAVTSAGHAQCCWTNGFIKVTVTP